MLNRTEGSKLDLTTIIDQLDRSLVSNTVTSNEQKKERNTSMQMGHEVHQSSLNQIQIQQNDYQSLQNQSKLEMQDDIIIEEVHKIKERKSMGAARSLPPIVPKL